MNILYTNYIEQYGHGKHEKNSLDDNSKVTIQDHDGHYFVYQADNDITAGIIANAFLNAANDESNCQFFSLNKNSNRSFYLEADNE